MLKKRIIPCLDIQNDRVVKGTNFLNLIDSGCPIELSKQYVKDGADELVFLDITASSENRTTLTNLVSNIAKEINIPFTVGGGIKSLDDAKSLLDSGADKISINTAAVNNPLLIKKLAENFGSQSIVLAIDTQLYDKNWMVYTYGGKVNTGIYTKDWVKMAEYLGAGEILLTVMSNDGTKVGFKLDILHEISQSVNIPVIASGGAGNYFHFEEVFTKTNVSAALAASIFHNKTISINNLKDYLKTKNISIR